MGFRRKNKKPRTESTEKRADDRDRKDASGYEANTLIRENAVLEAFYRAQGLVDESDFEAFMTCLRSPLPSTFRITGNRQYFSGLADVQLSNLSLSVGLPLLCRSIWRTS